jgi:hypothetical protein
MRKPTKEELKVVLNYLMRKVYIFPNDGSKMYEEIIKSEDLDE